MSDKKLLIKKDGIVIDNLSNGKYKVFVDESYEAICYMSGKFRQNKINILVGDKVNVELSPYDLQQGRIVYRYK